MQEKIWLIIFLSFFSGYIFRVIVGSYQAFMEMSDFIQARSDDCIMLLGEAVYKISFVDQFCHKILHEVSPEDAKALKITLDDNFNEWKKNTVASFIEQYPEHYQWQLEYRDWNGIMDRLDDIYKESKYKNE